MNTGALCPVCGMHLNYCEARKREDAQRRQAPKVLVGLGPSESVKRFRKWGGYAFVRSEREGEDARS